MAGNSLMDNVAQLVNEEIRLPSPPAIAVKILEIVRQEDFSFKHLAAVIQSDPALLARVLRLANSGFYGLPKKTSSIDTAVAVLGVNTLKNIALSFVIIEAFNSKEDERFDFDRFWRRSLTSAVAGNVIATAVGARNDDTFITNLFQDIGIVASFVCRRQSYLRVLEEKSVRATSLIAIEKEIMGCDHQEFGMELLKRWALPENVFIPIRYHHEPESAPDEFRQVCRIMRIADRLSAVYYGSSQIQNIQRVKEMLAATFSIGDEKAAQLIDEVAEKSAALQAQFEIAPDKIRPFSQILQEVNQELSRLNLSYEFLLIENREAKERAERLARELKLANDRLRDMAARDGLTNLFHHRHFMELLDQEMARAARYHRPLSLIMFDVDHFKSINDIHGHQTGDVVLKTIGEILTSNHRKSDFVARYGGEEFVMVLPETGLNGAVTKADYCRMTIENASMSVSDRIIKTTVSAGIAAWEPGQAADQDKLIEAADQALYRAKSAGRNRLGW